MRSILKVFLAIVSLVCALTLAQYFIREPEISLLKRLVIDYYTKAYQTAKNRPRNCTIAFGYTGCQDRKLDALELISKLNVSFTPNQKAHLLTIQDFVGTFAFYFKNGAATELFMENKESFNELISLANELKYESRFGGHAPHMALRAANENCDAVLIARIGEQEVQIIKGLDVNSKITFVGNADSGSDSDIHLIFEYSARRHENVTSPRANRFYLNHDVYSANLSTLEEYQSTVKRMGINKHAVAGFQMTQTLPTDKAIERLEAVKNQWQELRKDGPQNIHVELAAFSNSQIYEKVIQDLLLNTDSIGMNEQEAQTLIKFLKEKHLLTVANPYPKMEDMQTYLFEIIDEMTKRNSTASRIHAHGVAEHFLCYKGIASLH